MFNRSRRALSRNRGVIAALGLITLMAATYAAIGLEGPRARWVETTRMKPRDSTGREDGFDDAIVEFTPDGRGLLTYNDDFARLRDLESGRVVDLKHDEKRFASSDPPILFESAWMDSGRLLVGLVVGRDQGRELLPTLRVWEVPSGLERLMKPEIGAFVVEHTQKFTVSADGSTLAYQIGKAGSLRVEVWRSSDGKGNPLRSYPGSAPMALSIDGRFLAVGEERSATSNLVIWDTLTSRKLGTIPTIPNDWSEGIAVSPDGKTLADNRNGQLVVYEVAIAKQRLIAPSESTHTARFLADGLLLDPGSKADDEIELLTIWDLNVDPPSKLFQGKVTNFSKDGHRLIQWSEDQKRELKTIHLRSGLEPARGGPVPRPVMSRPVFEFPARPVQQRIDGNSLACQESWRELSSLGKAMSWIPRRFRPFNGDQISVKHIRVIDADSGETSRVIPLDDFKSIDRLDFDIVEDGKALALRQTRFTGDLWTTETIVEVWDIPGSPSPGFELGLLTLASILALGMGGWYDRKSRRLRATSLPGDSIALTTSS